jgi:hypothetical protein
MDVPRPRCCVPPIAVEDAPRRFIMLKIGKDDPTGFSPKNHICPFSICGLWQHKCVWWPVCLRLMIHKYSGRLVGQIYLTLWVRAWCKVAPPEGPRSAFWPFLELEKRSATHLSHGSSQATLFCASYSHVRPSIRFHHAQNGQKLPKGHPQGAIFKSICRPEFSTKTDDEVYNPYSMDQENTYKPTLACLGLFGKSRKKTTSIEKPLWSKSWGI